MKNYKRVEVECYSYHELIKEYENKYKQDYQLIGYEHDSINQIGVLVLYERGN